MNWGLFLAILIAVESGGDPNAVGDKHLTNKAYGVLQIRQPYLDDVNQHYKKVILAHWGRPLTLEDIKDVKKYGYYGGWMSEVDNAPYEEWKELTGNEWSA